jgi:hypothetical protein
MRSLTALHLTLLLTALWMGGALAQEAYYPNREGLSWTYSNGETQVIGGAREFGGETVTVLLHLLSGYPTSEDYLIYDASGVRTLGTAVGGQALQYEPALWLFPAAPLQVGQTWQSSARVQGIDITLSFEVLGVRGVQTQAGRFNALQIRQQTVTSTGGQTVSDLFFVPSIGTVRWVTQDGTVIDLIEKNF